jgi:hypothetical protein
MNYWLVKFVPFRYSWQDVQRNGKFEKMLLTMNLESHRKTPYLITIKPLQ